MSAHPPSAPSPQRRRRPPTWLFPQVLNAFEGTLEDGVAQSEVYEHSELLLYKAMVLAEGGKQEEALALLQEQRVRGAAAWVCVSWGGTGGGMHVPAFEAPWCSHQAYASQRALTAVHALP